MENASFVIDLDALPHPEDVRADDLGKWVHIGSPKSYIAVERNKSGHILDVQVTRQKRTDADYIMVVKQYLHHDKEAQYRKRMSFVYDSKSRRHRLALLQYYFEGEETLLNLKEHGNSKKQHRALCSNETKHIRTAERNIQKLPTPRGLFRSCTSEGGIGVLPL